MSILARAALVLALLGGTARTAPAFPTLGAIMAHSRDDLPGSFSTLSGNDATANATIPFPVVVGGTSYTTVTISTNGWLELGGNTQGTSDPANACLPTSKHTNPFLAFYWDDMRTINTDIRYGTVGTAPGRVFIVDFDLENNFGSNHDVTGQVQIHEGSHLVTVKYEDTEAESSGQTATIGFQGAGGSSATARPLTCNGKILDDNTPLDAWSIDLGLPTGSALAGYMVSSRDDLPGTFTTLSGNDLTANATIPFGVTIDGTSYTTVTISTNGWLEFGGNTQGTSDPTNACLPTAKHTNPFLAAYWDDMRTINSAIRYGTVGSSPNRTFIIDFALENNDTNNNDINFQVQVHERSHLITIKYIDSEPEADGQHATIGFQHAGGASATAESITCNGKVLDDNLNDTGWSIDLGSPNGSAVHGVIDFSRDDISGFTTLSGNETVATANLGFTVRLDGTSYTNVAISSNGWMEFGGNTAPAADPNNVCLPAANHMHHFLAGYWDDLRTVGNNIRYGTVGTGPGRVFVADFELENDFGSNHNLTMQVQVHEGSNLITVAYLDTEDQADGQTATIGYQGAGGGSAKVRSITCNGKVLDDNTTRVEGWSVAQAEVCGDGLDGSHEACDLGSANGSFSDCCTSTCTFRVAGSTCRAAAGTCDAAESCTGTSATCPADGFEPASTVCRPAAGVCDAAETCSGSGVDCPADGLAPAGTVCRAAAGVCDMAEVCTGASTACPTDGKSTGLCRAASGACDAAESCDGSSNDCPPDLVATAGTPCRLAAGACDVAESCDGTSAACPADAFVAAGSVCRPANGDCDVAESCTGTTAACPADGFAPSTTTCRPSIGPCDVAEQCTGTAPNCPADSVSGAFVECRAAAGSCDVAESCNGSSDACPPDQLEPATTVCRPAGGDCDLAESCTGSSADCPADAFAPATTVCRPPAGACDVAESCPGTGPSCPADQKSSGVCRAAAGTCDVAESCDGASNDCPPDSFVPVGTTCRAASGFCDVAEVCTGIGAACPPDVTLPDGTACNDANVCTAPDTCQAGACTGAPQPGTCVDHYLSYKIKPTTPFTLVPNVHLVDQFEDIHVDVIKVRNLCTPADKNGEGVIDDGTHLASYTFKPVPGTPKFIRRTNVRIDNQLGTLFVDAYKRDLLLVPTNKSLTGPTTPPDNTAIGVDHYKCYKVKTSAGTPRFSPTTVGVADQFTAPAKSFVLKKIKHLCTPVDKNGEGLKNADAHLACYQAKPASGQPKHQRRLGVNIANQFGSLVLGTIKESELCVPSIKTVTP